ncbi:60S ribosomal protein L22-2 [Zea mays]|uniref:60S ribosomal protein L22-2 n=1 Tax=Zea mays TaxID=4577 RepID=A0A1D6KVR7_MAIZE|nr:60S ribosomal protein L22-2 [Zea mays]
MQGNLLPFHECIKLITRKPDKSLQIRIDLGQLSGKSALYCLDASIARYLIARNWDKYLKKHKVRDWLRVIAANKDHDVYELWYFNIAENEGEEED